MWKRPLHDGSTAALLLNRGSTNLSITADFSDLGISGSAKIRDVWARKDLQTSAEKSYTAVVPGHGSLTLKITPDTWIRSHVCDSVYSDAQGGARFRRPYVQLDCPVGQHIASIERVVADDDLAAWRCGSMSARADTQTGTHADTQAMVEEARVVCVGKRTCRVRLGKRHAMALEGICS